MRETRTRKDIPIPATPNQWITKAHIHLVNGNFTPYFLKRPRESKTQIPKNPISQQPVSSHLENTTKYNSQDPEVKNLLTQTFRTRMTTTGIFLKNRGQYHQIQQYFPEVVFPEFVQFSQELQNAF